MDKSVDKRLAHLEKTEFKPGQSGNPKGRPKGIVTYVKGISDNAFKCAQLMMDVMEGKKLPGLKSVPGYYYRMEAAKWLTMQAWGHNPALTNNPDSGTYDLQDVFFVHFKKKHSKDDDLDFDVDPENVIDL